MQAIHAQGNGRRKAKVLRLFSVVDMNGTTGEIFLKKIASAEPPKQFTFDGVYDQNSHQVTIFNEAALPIIDNVLIGYNGTVFAYGQTGTGKTHTMEGEDKINEKGESNKGILPRAFETVFSSIESGDEKKTYLVRASYLEIYKEEIRDLLAKNPKSKLELKERTDVGVYVKDLCSFIVKNVKELEDIMLTGRKNRSTAETAMNLRSSRSHSIFTITIEMAEIGEDLKSHIRMGKLNLVDLAGSERQSKTQATGERLDEATKINLSLSTLCHVISTLVEAKNGSHIPYRNSKLTRLLQDSLGGNTKTVMIANIGPADYNYEESLNTLRYANRAKHITNNPKINEDPKDAMIRECQEEIQKLKDQLLLRMKDASGTGGGVVTKEEIIEIVVEDKQKLIETEQRLLKEKAEIEAKAEAERKKIEEQKNLAEEQKKSLLKELEKKSEEQSKTKEEQMNAIQKLKAMEAKLINTKKDVGKALKTNEELKKIKQENEAREKEKRRLEKQIKDRELEAVMIEKKFNSINEELSDKRAKCKEMQEKYKIIESQLNEKKEDFQSVKDQLMEEINDLTMELKLKDLTISSFIPEEESIELQQLAKFDENYEDWLIPNIQYAGNNIQKQIPLQDAEVMNMEGNTGVYFIYTDGEPIPEECAADLKPKKQTKRMSKKKEVPKKEEKKKMSFPKAKGLVSSKIQQD